MNPSLNPTFLAFILSVFFSFSPLFGATFAGPDTCAACHADIHVEWKSSVHARAYSDEQFRNVWQKEGKRAACLQCHTTGHTKGTLKFEHAGVTCESCHGALGDNHPASSPMPIPMASEMCKTCHQKTYLEWKLSKHGEKGIRCFDCHNVHGQGLRAGGGDKLCGSCHAERMKNFAHATHKVQGLQCSTCHMPQFANKESMINGSGAAGHALSVGAETCTRCHEETVHNSNNLPELREQLSDMKKQMSLAGVENAYDLKEQISTLEWKLSRARQSNWVIGLLFLSLGLILGWIVGWTLLRRRGPHE